MKMFDKIKWIAGISLIFIIVLATNLIDKNNFSRLSYSVRTIYEDRIIANDLIFGMSILIQEKEIAIAMSDPIFFKKRNTDIDQKLTNLIKKYEQTKLTEKEHFVLNKFKNNLIDLQNLEKKHADLDFSQKALSLQKINNIVHNFSDLSKIQLIEGKRQMVMSERTAHTINLFTQIEIIFLIFLAILVQIIVLYRPKN